MKSRLAVFSFFTALVAVTAACSSKEADAVGTSSQDVRVADVVLLGTIESGETKTACSYTPPNNSAWAFSANAGDNVTITVSSPVGDAVAYLTDARGNILAYNDDANPSTHDSLIQYEVPGSGNYDIVFGDFNHLRNSFNVSLEITSGVTCNYAGNTYLDGDTFPASDGCNTCTCSNGNVACGTNVCACSPGHDGLDYYGGPEWCKTTRYDCPRGQVRFSNDCGCGCETLTTTHRPRSSQ